MGTLVTTNEDQSNRVNKIITDINAIDNQYTVIDNRKIEEIKKNNPNLKIDTIANLFLYKFVQGNLDRSAFDELSSPNLTKERLVQLLEKSSLLESTTSDASKANVKDLIESVFSNSVGTAMAEKLIPSNIASFKSKSTKRVDQNGKFENKTLFEITLKKEGTGHLLENGFNNLAQICTGTVEGSNFKLARKVAKKIVLKTDKVIKGSVDHIANVMTFEKGAITISFKGMLTLFFNDAQRTLKSIGVQDGKVKVTAAETNKPAAILEKVMTDKQFTDVFEHLAWNE